jgi:hypothetical protein
MNSSQEERPTSNMFPPRYLSVVFRREPSLSVQQVLEKVAQETPNCGTEQACSIFLFVRAGKM